MGKLEELVERLIAEDRRRFGSFEGPRAPEPARGQQEV
mgnify:CR=1 FL=1